MKYKTLMKKLYNGSVITYDTDCRVTDDQLFKKKRYTEIYLSSPNYIKEHKITKGLFKNIPWYKLICFEEGYSNLYHKDRKSKRRYILEGTRFEKILKYRDIYNSGLSYVLSEFYKKIKEIPVSNVNRFVATQEFEYTVWNIIINDFLKNMFKVDYFSTLSEDKLFEKNPDACFFKYVLAPAFNDLFYFPGIDYNPYVSNQKRKDVYLDFISTCQNILRKNVI